MTTSPAGPIHHVAIVVRSIEAALARYRELFGLLPETQPFDFPAQGVRLCFMATGPAPAARIELVEPIDATSGVARFLEARGEGVHHICLATDDLPAELERLAARDVELIDREPRRGAHGTVAFIHPRALNGVLWELLQDDPAAHVNP